MTIYEKYDKLIIGVLSGFLLPFIIGLTVYLFTSHHLPLADYLKNIIDSDIVTHSVSLCVFPNMLIFLAFNRFDMLRATKGVLAVTIFWAVIVFGIKFLG
jgi:hypothetical protein